MKLCLTMSPLSRTPISVLDLARVTTGTTPTQALEESIDLARHTEALGYRRFWVAEHHNLPAVASAATSVLIGHIADATRTMRIGSGGIMLPNHAPLMIAERFGTLDALHPGRIDLGLGRAPGTDQLTARALGRDATAADNFPAHVAELRSFLTGSFPAGHPYRAITAIPGLNADVSIWLLGSSGYSAQLAGKLGLPFSFAHHFAARNTLPGLELYRSSFTPSDVLSKPYVLLGVSVLIAETDDRAQWLASPSGLAAAQLRKGAPQPYASPEETARHDWSDDERAAAESRLSTMIVGSPETAEKELEELLKATGADELIVTTEAYEQSDRKHSYELLARLAGLYGAA